MLVALIVATACTCCLATQPELDADAESCLGNTMANVADCIACCATNNFLRFKLAQFRSTKVCGCHDRVEMPS